MMKVWEEAENARTTQWWRKKCIQLCAIRTAFSKSMIIINEWIVAIFTIHLINLICWTWMSNMKPLFVSSTEWFFYPPLNETAKSRSNNCTSEQIKTVQFPFIRSIQTTFIMFNDTLYFKINYVINKLLWYFKKRHE